MPAQGQKQVATKDGLAHGTLQPIGQPTGFLSGLVEGGLIGGAGQGRLLQPQQLLLELFPS